MPGLGGEAADTSPGRMLTQAPQAGVAGFLACALCLDSLAPWEKLGEHCLLSTAGVPLPGQECPLPC